MDHPDHPQGPPPPPGGYPPMQPPHEINTYYSSAPHGNGNYIHDIHQLARNPRLNSIEYSRSRTVRVDFREYPQGYDNGYYHGSNGPPPQPPSRRPREMLHSGPLPPPPQMHHPSMSPPGSPPPAFQTGEPGYNAPPPPPPQPYPAYHCFSDENPNSCTVV